MKKNEPSIRTLKPREYLKEFFPGSSVTTVTVKNWIKTGKIPGFQNPGGGWMVQVGVPEKSNANKLLEHLEANR